MAKHRRSFLAAFVVATLVFGTGTAHAAPGNDDFASGTVIAGTSGTLAGQTNQLATGQSGEPAQSGTINSVWYSWTAPQDMILRLRSCGQDSFLSVFTGSDVAALTLVRNNDDQTFGNCGLPNGGSALAFEATNGTVYSFAVDGYSSFTGFITLHWSQGGDPDGDGLSDIEELYTNEEKTNPDDGDSDDDFVDDGDDAFPNNGFESSDNDGDTVGDNGDTDDDNDGYLDTDETRLGTDPLDDASTPSAPDLLVGGSANATFSCKRVHGKKVCSVRNIEVTNIGNADLDAQSGDARPVLKLYRSQQDLDDEVVWGQTAISDPNAADGTLLLKVKVKRGTPPPDFIAVIDATEQLDELLEDNNQRTVTL